MVAETDLTIEGLTGARAGALTNTSGRIVAVTGDLTLKTAALSNNRLTVTVETVTGSEETTDGDTTTSVVTTTEQVTGDSPAPARLQAGSDLVIDTGALTNRHAQIAAGGDLTISATSLTSIGRTLTETVETTVTTAGSDPTVTTATTETATSTIWAGGTLGVTLTGALDNGGTLGARGTATVTAGAALTNRAAGRIAGSDGVAVTAASVTNAGRIQAQGGPLTIDTAGGLTNSGILVSLTSATLKVDGDVVNRGDLLVEEALVVRGLAGARSGTLTNQAGGTINSGTGSYTVAGLSNAGTLTAHDSSLTIDVTGNLTNAGTLSAKTDTGITVDGDLTNRGRMIAEGAITLSGRDGARLGALTTTAGSILNAGTGLTVKATSLDNAGDTGSAGGFVEVELTENLSNSGLLYSNTSSRYRLDGTFTNRGRVVAETDLTIEGLTGARAGALTNTSGRIVAVTGDLTLKTAAVSNNRLTVTVETVTGSEETTDGDTTTSVVTTAEQVTGDSPAPARLQAGGNLVIDTGALTNRHGQIAATGDLTISATSLTSIGRRLTGTVETTTTTAGSAPAVTTIDTVASTAMVETGGVLTITTPGGLDNSGMLLSLTSADLNVDGSVTNSGDLLVEGALTLDGATNTHSGALSNQEGGTINSGSGTYRVASLTNAGTMTAHDTSLTIETPGNVTNSGELGAETDLDIRLDGNLTNAGTGSIISEGQMTLEGHTGERMSALRTYRNSLINGGAGLTIEAASLTNRDRIGSANGALIAELTGSLSNTGLLYSGTSSHYRLNGSFTNTEADVLAETNLTIEGLTRTRAGALTNTSGRIEAISGNLTLKVASLTNQRRELEVDSTTTTAENTVTVVAPCRDTSYGWPWTHCAGDHDSDHEETTDTITTTAVTTTDEVVKDSEQAELLAGSSIVIQTGTLSNNYSHIAANSSITIHANSVTNVGLDLKQTVVTTTQTVHEEWHCGSNHCSVRPYYIGTTTDPEETVTVTTALEDATKTNKLFGTIHAGGTLRIYVRGSLQNADDIPGYDGEFKDEAIRNRVSGLSAPAAGNRRLPVAAVDRPLAAATSADRERVRALVAAVVDAVLGEVDVPDGGPVELSVESALVAAVVSALLGNVDFSDGEAADLTSQDALLAALVENILGDLNLADDEAVDLASQDGLLAALVENILGDLDLADDEAVDFTSQDGLLAALVNTLLGHLDLSAGELADSTAEAALLAALVNTVLGEIGITAPSDELSAAITDALETARADGERDPEALVETIVEILETQVLAEADVPATPIPYSAVPLTSLRMSIDSLLRRTSLFVQELAPDVPYLIETRPEFIKRDQYLGSDYFLERVGLLHADQILKRLGDSYVETRLIQDQIFDLTGRRYVGGAQDYRSLMQALYDNAVDAYRSLALTIGVALSPSQIAALSGNIIWLERHTVGGQEVLVPRLYLASSTLDSLDLGSASITGSTTIINAAHVINSGLIAGTDALAISTAGDLLNIGGSLLSGGDIGIDAGGLFANQSGIVFGGGDVGIQAGAILNETLSERIEFAGGFADQMLQVAQITAGGSLHLDAAGFIQSIGGVFESGEEMTLLAGDDISILALQLANEHDFEFDGGFEHSSALINQLATLDAGGDLTMLAGGDLTIQGGELTAGADATLFALGDTTIESVQDFQHDEYQLDTESGGFLGLFSTGTSIHEMDVELDTLATTISAGGDLTIASGTGDLTLDAVDLGSGGDILLSAEQGTVALLSNTDQSSEQEYEHDQGVLWFTEEDQGHNEESIEHVTIEQGGELTIVAGDGVVVEYERVGSQQESLDQLVQTPELAWMQQLRDDPNVDWNGLDAAFEEWDYQTQGLTPTGAALVSLIVGVATGGTLSGAAASITNALSLGANVALQAGVQSAIQAGLTSLVNRAAVLLVNNLGDIGATLQQLASLETLTTLGTAMLTAGLTTGLTEAAGLGGELVSTAPLADRVAEDLQQGLIGTAVDTGVSTLIEGEELGDALLSSLRAEAAGVLGENLAQEIGAAVDNGDLDTAGQLIAHAALGCATGLLAADDCPSAAAGAVIGEATALLYEQQIDGWLDDGQTGTLSIDEITDQLADMRDAGVDLARLASGFAVGLAGGDAEVAAQAGANAAENNVFILIPILIGTLEAIDKALLAHDAAKLAEATMSGDQELATELATDLAISVSLELTAGNIIPGSVLAKKIVQKITKVLRKKGLDDVSDVFTNVATHSDPSSAYHYTSSKWRDSIMEDGLRRGTYATPIGDLSPLQAQLELALPPTRDAPNMKIRIDLDGLRQAGYEIPAPKRVSGTVPTGDGRVYQMPGGGYEIQFPYEIPPEYLEIIPIP